MLTMSSLQNGLHGSDVTAQSVGANNKARRHKTEAASGVLLFQNNLNQHSFDQMKPMIV